MKLCTTLGHRFEIKDRIDQDHFVFICSRCLFAVEKELSELIVPQKKKKRVKMEILSEFTQQDIEAYNRPTFLKKVISAVQND